MRSLARQSSWPPTPVRSSPVRSWSQTEDGPLDQRKRESSTPENSDPILLHMSHYNVAKPLGGSC